MHVLKGDIGIVQGGSRNSHTGELLKGDHTFMIVQDTELTASTPTVHLTLGGLYRWDFSFQGAKYICRCPDASLSARAAQYALSWLTALPATDEGGRNSYSPDRAKAVMHDLNSGGELEFGFDAFRRALKWQRRLNSPFSRTKGLTCAAWTVACYQAAALLDPEIKVGALDNAWALVDEGRVAKLKATERGLQPGVKNPYYREHANVGAKDDDTFSKALVFLKKTDENEATFFNRIMTKALVVDARFLHTDGLIKRIKGAESGGWKVFAKGQDFR